MTTPFKGKYSSSIGHSPKKRYYVLQAQRNTPLLDAEVRELSETMLDMNRWLARNSFGDVAVVSGRYSDRPDEAGMHRVDGFKVMSVGGSPSSRNLDFKVYGGLNSDGYNDLPAVMYLKGWYIFLSEDVKWSDQNDNPDDHLTSIIKEYPGEVIPDPNDPGTTLAEKLSYAVRSDTYVKDVGQIQPGSVGQRDIVYVELTLDEVTAGGSTPVEGSPDLQDPSLKDPVIGNQTANRVKASVKFLVAENWTGADPLTGAIFSDPFFAEGEYATGVKYLRAPLALLTRSHSTIFSDSDFTDLLELQDKRVYPPVEITHRLRHGGYTQNDVDGGRASSSDIDETWGATGCNEGLGTESLNSNSVTPRVLKNDGDYRMRALALAGSGATGASGTIQPNPDGLNEGELTSKKIFTDRAFIRSASRTDSSPSLENARTDLDDSLLTLEGRGFTGSLIKVRTSELPNGKNYFWTQLKDNDTVVSQLDASGRAALGKEVQGSSGYHLDVAGKSNFDDHADFRGTTNHFWNDVGVTGSARIFNALWDRQSNMYMSPVNGTGTPAYWKVCQFSTNPSQATDLTFILNIAANSGSSSQPDRYGSFKIRLNKTSSVSSPFLEVVALHTHKFLKENLLISVASGSATSLTLQAYIKDDNSGKGYSYNATDLQNVNGGSLLFYSTGTTTWTATIPSGALPASTVKYADGHFGSLYADRMSYRSFSTVVDLQNTVFEYTLASRALSAKSASYQSFVVVVKDPSGSNSLNMSCRVNLQISDGTSPSYPRNVALTVTDLTWSKSYPYGDVGLIKFAVGSGSSSYNLNMFLSDYDITSPSPATQRSLVVEVSEDPFYSGSSVAEPLVLAGSEGTTTVLTPGAGALVSTDAFLRTYTRQGQSAEPTPRHRALSTTASVDLRGPTSYLDMSDLDAWGVTGTKGPRLKDLSWRVGSDGQYLSATTQGVLWRDIPVYAVDSIAALRLINPVTFAAKSVLVRGYYAVADGSSDIFIYDPDSSVSDDGGVFIAYQGNNLNPGRFVRQIKNNTVSVYDYGAIPGYSGGFVINRDPQIAAAIASAEQNGFDLVIPSGSIYATSSSMDFPEGVAVTVGSGVFLYTYTTRPTWTFRGPTSIESFTAVTHFSNGPKLHFSPTALTEVRPEWWYAVAGKNEFGVDIDNTDALSDMYSSLLADVDEAPSTNSYTRGFTVVYGDNSEYGSGVYNGFYYINGEVEITSKSKFVGSAGIRLGDDATLTISADIDAPNTLIFLYPDVTAGTVYYCSSGPIEWGTNAPAKVNVTWFGVLPGEESDTPAYLRNMLNNFECNGVNVTMYFPPGTYKIGVEGDPDLDFFKNPVEQASGALLTWYKMNVRIKYPVDSLNAKFDQTYFFPGDSTKWKETWAPSLGGGVVRPEWFISHSTVTDKLALQMALNCLTSSTWDGELASPDPLSEAYSSENEFMWLDGGGQLYLLDGAITMRPGYRDGATLETVSRNLGIRNLKLDYDPNAVASPTFTYLASSSLSASISSLRCRTVGLRIEDCAFYGSGSATAWSNTLTVYNAYRPVIRNCSFFRSQVTLSTVGSSTSTFYEGLMENCYLENSIVSSPANNSAKFLGNRFKVITETTNNILGAYYFLTVGSLPVSSNYSMVMGNTFDIPVMYTSGSTVALSNVLYTHNQCVVANNVFNNGKYTSLGCKEMVVTGNMFRCSVDLGAVLKDDSVDSFISLVADSSVATAENATITGNSFDVKYPSNEEVMKNSFYPDGYTYYGQDAYDYIFEAISLDESTGSFSDSSIYDVVVKDNTANRLVNLRSTELTETVYILGNTGYTDATGINVPDVSAAQLPPSTGNVYFPDTGKRLFGYPQEVQAFAWEVKSSDPSTSAPLFPENYAVSLTAVSFSNTTVVPALPRYRPNKVLARYCAPESGTWSLGLPDGKWFRVSCKFITYRSRHASVDIWSNYNAGELDGSFVYHTRSRNAVIYKVP